MTVLSPAGWSVQLSRGGGNICFPPKLPPLDWRHPDLDPQSGCEKTFLILVPSGRWKTPSLVELWIKNVNRAARFWGFFSFQNVPSLPYNYDKKRKLFCLNIPLRVLLNIGRSQIDMEIAPQSPMVIGCIISPCQTHSDCPLILANSSLVDLTLNILSWEAEFINLSCYCVDDFPIYLDIHAVFKG